MSERDKLHKAYSGWVPQQLLDELDEPKPVEDKPKRRVRKNKDVSNADDARAEQG